MTTKKAKLSQVQIISYTMLATGLFIVTFSFFFNSSIGALIGLGLTFWGAILLYIKPDSSDRRNLFEAAISSSFETLRQLIQELGYVGDITYLPPKYFANPATSRICITKNKYGKLPTPEQIRLYENQPVGLTPQALFLTPSGIQISSLLEKALGKSFTEMKLESLQQELPKVITEDLEIAENFEIQIAENLQIETTSDITAKAGHKQSHSNVFYCQKCGTELEADSKFCHACGIQVISVPESPKRSVMQKASTTVKNTAIHARITRPADGLIFRGSQECPICSAIGIALSRATGKPIRTVDVETSEEGDIIEAEYVVTEG